LTLHIVPASATLPDCDVEAGRNLAKDWLRTLSGRAALTPGSLLVPGPTTYARHTASGMLWLLRQVLAYVRNLGHPVPLYAEGSGIHALHPVGRPKKRRAPLVSVEVTASIAGQLHVVHRTVLWLLRLRGFRISESYGLLVANFFVDADGDGFILTEAQGGKSFRVRKDDGAVEVTNRKESGKTDAATRLVALPAPLTFLLMKLIEAFHTLPDGSIDTTARLIPTIRSEHGGQGDFVAPCEWLRQPQVDPATGRPIASSPTTYERASPPTWPGPTRCRAWWHGGPWATESEATCSAWSTPWTAA
jgi:hypothetical protein